MIWKFVHILGAVLLIGNVVTTGLWSHWAMGERDRAVAIFAAGAILWADLWLTLGGGAMLTIGAIAMVTDANLPWWEMAWTRNGALALLASTGAWLAVLLPCQLKMRTLAAAGDMAALRKVFLVWSVVGWAATAALIGGLWVMVVRA